MALLSCDFKSNELLMNVDFLAIIPEYVTENIPTLYLYHGLSSNFMSWQRYTSIERYAAKKGVAVIMPDVGRSFYCDMKYGGKYFTYVTSELVDYTRRLFRLSTKREDTYTAGCSMGGYGAFKAALTKPEIFGGAISLSGCLGLKEAYMVPEDVVKGVSSACKAIWGENYMETVPDSDDDLYHLVSKFDGKSRVKPRLYQACGTEDFIYGNNTDFRKFIEGKGFDYTYEEGKGAHTWEFWDEYIKKGLDFAFPEKEGQ